MIDWLIDWFIGWLIDWLIDWLTDWLKDDPYKKSLSVLGITMQGQKGEIAQKDLRPSKINWLQSDKFIKL